MATVSRRHVIKSASDLIDSCEADHFKKFKFQAKMIKSLMNEWNEKMKLLQKEGYDEKKLLNAKKESKRRKDLAFLKSQTPPGPFTNADEIRQYNTLDIDESQRNKRMYIEVRYARVTSLTLKSTSPLFRLKRDGKNLDTTEYTENLIKYMDDSESVNSLTLDDLNCVLNQLQKSDHFGTDEPTEELIEKEVNCLYYY